VWLHAAVAAIGVLAGAGSGPAAAPAATAAGTDTGAVVLVATATAPATGRGVLAAAAPAADAGTVVLRLKSVTLTTSLKDVPPRGPSRGDVYSGRFRLLNAVAQLGRKAGAAVGSERSALTLTSGTRGVIAGVVTLPGGTIAYEGRGRLGSRTPIPVVRGTGRFSGVHGTLTVGNGASPLNTYRLTLP